MLTSLTLSLASGRLTLSLEEERATCVGGPPPPAREAVAPPADPAPIKMGTGHRRLECGGDAEDCQVGVSTKIQANE